MLTVRVGSAPLETVMVAVRGDVVGLIVAASVSVSRLTPIPGETVNHVSELTAVQPMLDITKIESKQPPTGRVSDVGMTFKTGAAEVPCTT